MADSNWSKKGRGGSYAGWTKAREAPSKYAKTPQQKKIAAAGREVGKTCKGKTGSAFKECRIEVLEKLF